MTHKSQSRVNCKDRFMSISGLDQWNLFEAQSIPFITKINRNKKVLLRERKRHTARSVASARYAGAGGTPSSHGAGVPHSVMVGGGYPIQSWWRDTTGTPLPSRPGRGTPPPTIKTWLRYPLPSKPGWGTPLPPSRLGWGTPPTIQTCLGYPPPTIQTWLGYPPC